MLYRITEIALATAVAIIVLIMAAAMTIPPLTETDFLAIAVALG